MAGYFVNTDKVNEDRFAYYVNRGATANLVFCVEYSLSGQESSAYRKCEYQVHRIRLLHGKSGNPILLYRCPWSNHSTHTVAC